MADTTHDIPDDGFHEIHLSGKQLVFLFMATTVVSVVIFLCGVLVGRGVRAEQGPDSLLGDPVEASSTAPAASPYTPAESPPVAAEPPAPPAESADDALRYPQRLQDEAVHAETLNPAPAAPASEPEPAPARARRNEPPPAAELAAQSAGAQPGTWVVQVHALRDRGVANGIVQRLARKGYPAFLVASGPPAGIYRVHVGRYKDRAEAERIVERLKKEEQFKPWITR